MTTLDPTSPVPLYHQIAEGVAYRIAVGRLRPGELLPSVRAAADALGVHYLTVRKAYGALEERGLVERRRGIGTRITRAGSSAPAGGAVWAVECNAPQAADYAGQLSEALGVRVGTCLLTGDRIAPPGLLVGTYFHFNEIRARWADRGPDLRFVAVRPDPGLTARLRTGRRGGGPRSVRLCEVDSARAHNALPDLAGMLPADEFAIRPILVDRPGAPLEDDDPSPILYSPRLWARLDDRERADPRAILLRYRIDADDLATLRAAFDHRVALAS